MFSHILQRQSNKKLARLSNGSLLLPTVVLLLGLTITGMYATSTRDINEKDYQAGLTQQAESLSAYTTTAMRAYGQRLKATAAMMSIKHDISAAGWHEYYDRARSDDTLSAMLGVGYVPVLSHAQLQDEGQVPVSSLGTPVTIYPTSEREVYAPILYLDPSTLDNRRAIGFDMYSDPSRKKAMEQARDTGEIAMTNPVLLVQDKDKQHPHFGILIYYPVYVASSSPTTVAERRTALEGYTYIVLRPQDVIAEYSALTSEKFAGSHVTVYDITEGQEAKQQLYTPAPTTKNLDASVYHGQAIDKLYGRTWMADISSNEMYSRKIGPSVIATTGALLSFLLAGLVYGLFSRRIRHVRQALESEVKRTKDELLALASHQLRTPASGVKQYIGILTSGIVGELNDQQQQIAQKAYDTNERQLRIINDMLYVSRLEAGQLVLEFAELNLTALIQKSIDENHDYAAEKNITLVFRTKKPCLLWGDASYISMIIDNLISNAIKYSHNDASVTISLKKSRGTVTLAVSDTGVGIDESDYEKVFDKFTRVSNSLSTAAGGSGLGLFLARQLARAHGGDITIASALERGATFTVTLPVAKNDTPKVIPLFDTSAR